MRDAEQRDVSAVAVLSDDDRVWLQERLADYRELLTYLRDH
jgi:hypothetical protein